ncbi:MAG: hypothetical protein AABY15_06720 [Nanoarchaeota archaeon]
MQYDLNVHEVQISGCNEKMFKEFFEIDADFSENEDYFREDTTDLGFENEAERCSKELFKKYEKKFYGKEAYADVLKNALDKAANYHAGDTQFILGSSTYTSKYEISIICTNEEENEYTVIVSVLSIM